MGKIERAKYGREKYIYIKNLYRKVDGESRSRLKRRKRLGSGGK